MPMRDRSRAAVSRQTLVGLRSVALGAGGCAGRHQRTFLPRQRRKRGQRSPGPPPALSRPPSRTEHPSRRRASRRWAACQCGNRRALPARAPWTGLERCRCRRSTHPAPLPPASRRATCPTNTTKGGPGRLQRPHERAANQIGGFGLQAHVLARASGLIVRSFGKQQHSFPPACGHVGGAVRGPDHASGVVGRCAERAQLAQVGEQAGGVDLRHGRTECRPDLAPGNGSREFVLGTFFVTKRAV